MGYHSRRDFVGQRCRVRDAVLMRLCGWIHEQEDVTAQNLLRGPSHYRLPFHTVLRLMSQHLNERVAKG